MLDQKSWLTEVMLLLINLSGLTRKWVVGIINVSCLNILNNRSKGWLERSYIVKAEFINTKNESINIEKDEANEVW